MIYGLTEARKVESDISRLGIKDIRLLFDEQLKMWAVVHVQGQSGLLLPETFQPHMQLLWWVKDSRGQRRLPSNQDVSDIVITRQRAEIAWRKGGEWLADRLEEQDKERDQKHREKQHQMIKDIAPQMKKAIRKELS